MRGQLVSGDGVGEQFVGAAEDVLAQAVGFRPFHGTLNLQAPEGVGNLPLQTIDEDLGDERCSGVQLRRCAVGGVLCCVVRPIVPDYPNEKVEILAPVRLRTLFGLEDGASVSISQPAERWLPDGPEADPGALDQFDAVVFDLDGTLVDLAIDWPAVHTKVEALLDPHIDRSIQELGRNGVFAAAAEHGVHDELVEFVTTRELEGASEADRLAALDHLTELSCPVGICTANAMGAASRALDKFDARDAVAAIVARETIPEGKPHPRPLLTCVERLGVDPGNALFVGDEPSDAETAARAETSFLHVEQLWPVG